MKNIILYEIDWSAIGSILSALAAIFALYIAIIQLKGINKNISDSNMMKVMEIEFEINRRLERAQDLRKSILEKDYTEVSNNINTEKFNIELNFYYVAYENYLNSLDRLCGFIQRGALKHDDFKEDYKETLCDIVNSDEFNSKHNGFVKYKNIVELNKNWND